MGIFGHSFSKQALFDEELLDSANQSEALKDSDDCWYHHHYSGLFRLANSTDISTLEK